MSVGSSLVPVFDSACVYCLPQITLVYVLRYFDVSAASAAVSRTVDTFDPHKQ
jgi:hypothetical protein